MNVDPRRRSSSFRLPASTLDDVQCLSLEERAVYFGLVTSSDSDGVVSSPYAEVIDRVAAGDEVAYCRAIRGLSNKGFAVVDEHPIRYSVRLCDFNVKFGKKPSDDLNRVRERGTRYRQAKKAKANAFANAFAAESKQLAESGAGTPKVAALEEANAFANALAKTNAFAAERKQFSGDNARPRVGAPALSDNLVTKVSDLQSDSTDSIPVVKTSAPPQKEEADVDVRVFEIISIFDLPITPNNIKFCQRRVSKYGELLPDGFDLVDAAFACHQHAVNQGKVTKDWFSRWDTWMRNCLKDHQKKPVAQNGSGPIQSDYPEEKTGIELWDRLMPYLTYLSRTEMLPQRQLRDPTYRRFKPVSQHDHTLELKPDSSVLQPDLKTWQNTIKEVARQCLHENVQVSWVQ